MIHNDAQLEIVRQQLGRAEAALLSWRKSMLPLNRAKYELVAESYLGAIVSLRSEIDAYLGLESAYAPLPYLVMSLEGAGISLGEARVSLVGKTLAHFRSALESLFEFSRAASDTLTQVRESISQVCDPPLLGIAPGSLRILFAEPDFSESAANQDATHRELVDLLLHGVELADRSAEPSRNGKMPDRMRRAVCAAVLKISPSLKGELETVSFGGRALGNRQLAPLSKASTRWLKQEIRRLDETIGEKPRDARVFEGEIRKIDFDNRRILLRQNGAARRYVRFRFEPSQEETVAALARQCVAATGVEIEGRAGRSEYQLAALKRLVAH